MGACPCLPDHGRRRIILWCAVQYCIYRDVTEEGNPIQKVMKSAEPQRSCALSTNRAHARARHYEALRD
eukprot:scaffold7339_cov249-Pinguiococcus_pyrenoidosus.AAC.13